jgi:hypothetical protein
MALTILLRCPGCAARIKAPRELFGKRRNCPGCGTSFLVQPSRPPDSDPILVTVERWVDRTMGK